MLMVFPPTAAVAVPGWLAAVQAAWAIPRLPAIERTHVRTRIIVLDFPLQRVYVKNDAGFTRVHARDPRGDRDWLCVYAGPFGRGRAAWPAKTIYGNRLGHPRAVVSGRGGVPASAGCGGHRDRLTGGVRLRRRVVGWIAREKGTGSDEGHLTGGIN